MISQSLKNWQQSRRYRIDGDTVYGVANGVGFSVTEEDGGALTIFMLSGPDSAFDSFEQSLTSQSSRLREIAVGDVEGYLALFFDESAGKMPDSLLDELLGFTADSYRAAGFRMLSPTCLRLIQTTR